MKKILLTLLLTLGLNATTTNTGTVLETMNSSGYSYMKVKDGAKAYWIAMTQRKIKVGDKISFVEESHMQNFRSKTLNRTFDDILFASDPVTNTLASKLKVKSPNIMTSKYKEANTISIADLISKRDSYVGKEVTIKGVVSNVSMEIMKRNWIHIGDGSRYRDINDVVFTTEGSVPKVGDVVYATGTVEKDVDFGYGYFYHVIIQKSTFKQ